MINRDQLRQEKQQQCQARLEAIYRSLPELEQLDLRIGRDNIALIRAGVLRKNPQERDRLAQEIQDLLSARRALLAAHQLTEDIYEPQWNCPLCKDRGYTEPGVLCKCYEEERLEELFLQSGMSEAMRRYSFDNFHTDYYENASDMEHKLLWCKQFAWQVQQGSCPQCLFLTGGVGRGKTHLSAAVANAVLAAGCTVLYRRAADLFELLRQYRYEEDRQKLEQMLEQLRTCDLLVIDDLGAERTTEFVVEQLVILLEERNYRDKPWIISSNLSINEISAVYNDRTADRIVDRAVIFKLERADSLRVDRARARMAQL